MAETFDYSYHSDNWSLTLRYGRRWLSFDAYPNTARLYANPVLRRFLPGRRLFQLGRWTVIAGRV